MKQPWVYMCPHPDPPSHFPLYPIPLGLPVHQVRALVSCILPGLVICFTLDNIHVSIHQPDCESKGTAEMSIFLAILRKDCCKSTL